MDRHEHLAEGFVHRAELVTMLWKSNQWDVLRTLPSFTSFSSVASTAASTERFSERLRPLSTLQHYAKM